MPGAGGQAYPVGCGERRKRREDRPVTDVFEEVRRDNSRHMRRMCRLTGSWGACSDLIEQLKVKAVRAATGACAGDITGAALEMRLHVNDSTGGVCRALHAEMRSRAEGKDEP